MSERITASAGQQGKWRALLSECPVFAAARPAVQDAIVCQDMARAVLGDGLAEEDYVQAVRDWEGTAEELLAEGETVVPGEETAPPALAQQPEGDPAEFVKRAVAAFRKGTHALLVSRVECGQWCQEYYAWRLAAGLTKREDSTALLRAALSPYAEAPRDADPALFARLWNAASVLGGGDAGWKKPSTGLTLGKLEALSSLLVRPEGTETHALVREGIAEDAAGLWAVACDGGKGRIGRDELADRVLKLRDPDGWAVKHAPSQPAAGAPSVEDAPVEPGVTPATLAAAQVDEEDEDDTEEAPEETADVAEEEEEEDGPQKGLVTGSVLKAAELSSPQQLAESLAEQLTANQEPDHVLERLLTLLSAQGDLSGPSRRACKAALVLLHRADAGPAASVSPVQAASRLANRNGALASV